MQLYPNDAVFPEPHVCLRLELAAAGRWPEAGPASKDDSRVPSAMLKVCLAVSSCEAQYNFNLNFKQKGDEADMTFCLVVTCAE